MKWLKEEIDLILIIGAVLIIFGLGLTVFREDKALLQKAVIKLPNNEIVTGEVEEWSYIGTSTVKVKLKNGKQYLGHSSDIVLYND